MNLKSKMQRLGLGDLDRSLAQNWKTCIDNREGRRASGNSNRFRIKNILSNVLCSTLNISDLGFTKFTIIVLIISAGRGRGGAGIKILNPSPPRPGVRGQNIAPSPPHHLCGAGKTRAGWGGAKQGGAKLPSLCGICVKC